MTNKTNKDSDYDNRAEDINKDPELSVNKIEILVNSI